MKISSLFWVCLIITATGLPAEASNSTEYLAVFMQGKKVGYSVHSRVVADGKVTTSETVNLTISRFDIPVTMKMKEVCVETVDGEPLGFETVQEVSMAKMSVTGIVNKQGMVNLTVESMGSVQKNQIEWPAGAVMAEGLRLIEQKRGLKEGSEYDVKLFSPSVLQAVDARIRIGPRQKVDLLGRVVVLTEVLIKMNVPGGGEIVSTSYVDDELQVQKSIVPVMGMQIETVACTRDFALGDNDVLEFVDKMFLVSPEPLGDISQAKSITYYISPTTEGRDLIIPSNNNQNIRRLDDGRAVVTVRPTVAPTGTVFPYRGNDKMILEATEPTRFLQSDNEQIIKLARQAVGDTQDAALAVRKIEAFVSEYINKKNLSIGYASATEVAASREGDCTEFAVLTASMCRAVGIPAQVVMGIAYVKDFAGLHDRFGGHAWVQAYVGGETDAGRQGSKWVGLDAAFKSAGLGGYDAGHIGLAFGNGSPGDFLNLATIMGQFRIDKVIVEKNRRF